MYPQSFSKPKPASHRRTSSSLSKSTGASSLPPSSLDFPTISSTTIKNDLAASTLNHCKPPESPPTLYDQLFRDSPSSPSEGRSSSSGGQVGNKSKTSAIEPNFIPSNSFNFDSSRSEKEISKKGEEEVENIDPFQAERSKVLSVTKEEGEGGAILGDKNEFKKLDRSVPNSKDKKGLGEIIYETMKERTSPIRHRHRLSSTASIHSLSSSPLKGTRNGGPKSPQQISSLHQENYSLTLRVTELEEEKEENERDKKRKIRKLEKEVLALKKEVERVEERNVVLEEKTTISNASESGGNRKLMQSTSREGLRSTITTTVQDVFTPTSNRFSGHHQSLPTDSPLAELDLNTPYRKSPDSPQRDPFVSSTQHRKPGTPGESFLPPQSLLDAFQSPLLPSLSNSSPTLNKRESNHPAVGELVVRLRMKIAELEVANESYEQTQGILESELQRAQKAQRDAEESMKNMEEWVDQQEEVRLGWKNEPSLIGWKEGVSPASPIRNHHQRAISISPESYQRERRRSKGKGRQSSSALIYDRFDSPRDPRSLGSELGSDWNQQSDSTCSDLDFDNDNDDTFPHPTTFSQTRLAREREEEEERMNYSQLDTSSDLFERGSMRFSPPDQDEYENLIQAVDDLPAKWEKEGKAMNMTVSRRRRSNISKALAWNNEEESENEAEDDSRRTIRGKGSSATTSNSRRNEDLWERSIYPEDSDLDFSRIGMGEGRQEAFLDTREVSPSRYSGALGNRRGHVDSRRSMMRRRYNNTSSSRLVGREEQLSRREMALERMGLSPNSYNSNPFEFEYSSDERSDVSREEEEEEEEMSEYDHVEGGRKSDYLPIALRARYAPRMIRLRILHSAITSAVTFFTYIRFFLILALAVFYALWQGPKKTLGLVDSRRRLK